MIRYLFPRLTTEADRQQVLSSEGPGALNQYYHIFRNAAANRLDVVQWIYERLTPERRREALTICNNEVFVRAIVANKIDIALWLYDQYPQADRSGVLASPVAAHLDHFGRYQQNIRELQAALLARNAPLRLSVPPTNNLNTHQLSPGGNYFHTSPF